MSQENVEALRAVYDEWSRGNFRAGVELYDDRIVYVPLSDMPGSPDHYFGTEGVRQYMREQLQAWTTLTIAAEEFMQAAGSVVVAARWRAIGAGGHVPVEWEGFHVWSFRGPKVIRLELFENRAEALETVGLSE